MTDVVCVSVHIGSILPSSAKHSALNQARLQLGCLLLHHHQHLVILTTSSLQFLQDGKSQHPLPCVLPTTVGP